MTNILVVGGTGTTGRRVATRLNALGHQVRIGNRPTFDWDNPATWPAAVAGMTAAYLTYAPDLGLPEAAGRITDFAALARDAGVTRLVLLSGRGQHNHAPAERAVQQSGLEWTVIRSAWFAQNFTEGFLAESVASGTLAVPAAEARDPFVDADDLADVAVAALTSNAQGVLELTGPDLLTFTEAAAALSEASGAQVTYHPITAAAFTTALAAEGTPVALTEVLTEVFADLRAGKNATTTNDVERLLGHPPRDFTTFARAAYRAPVAPG